MKRIIIFISIMIYCATLVAQVVCPIDEQLKVLKEKKLLEKTIAVHTTEFSFVAELADDIPLATFGLLCDVRHKSFEKWLQDHPNAETYAMFSCSYNSNNQITRVTMYYKALNPEVPDKLTEEYIQQIIKENEELQKNYLIVLEKEKVLQMVKNGGFDIRGVEDYITEYDPLLYYCGSGAVKDPNQRGFLERIFVPQVANFACFVHDKQYLILDKLSADKALKKNSYLEMIARGRPKSYAKALSDTYYQGVRLAGHLAYFKAQVESTNNKFGTESLLKSPLPLLPLPLLPADVVPSSRDL
jgi:hypothetical protein